MIYRQKITSGANMEYDLSKLWNQSRLDMRSINNIDLSELPQRIVVNKNARQILWHIINNTFTEVICANSNCDNQVKWLNNHYQKFCGRKCAARSNDTREKCKDTCNDKYGVDNPSKNYNVKMKIQETTLKRYGFRYPFQDIEFINESKKSLNEKYGVDSFSKTHEFRKNFSKNNPKRKRFSKQTLDIIDCKEKFNNLATNKTLHYVKYHLENYDLSTLRNYAKIYNTHYDKSHSNLEIEMMTFLNQLNMNYVQNDRSVIGPKELDFYLPDYNIAIEMNGIYWHS